MQCTLNLLISQGEEKKVNEILEKGEVHQVGEIAWIVVFN
jgi:hypothetical protein